MSRPNWKRAYLAESANTDLLRAGLITKDNALAQARGEIDRKDKRIADLLAIVEKNESELSEARGTIAKLRAYGAEASAQANALGSVIVTALRGDKPVQLPMP